MHANRDRVVATTVLTAVPASHGQVVSVGLHGSKVGCRNISCGAAIAFNFRRPTLSGTSKQQRFVWELLKGRRYASAFNAAGRVFEHCRTSK
jgi:hypothetical protein